MTNDEYNPLDPEFLASCEIDGDLSEDERQRLDEALAGSESLHAEREELRALDALVGKWAARQADADWETHGKLVDADVKGETSDEKLKAVDRLLDGWSRRTESVDDDAFASGVMVRIAPPRRRLSVHSKIFRLGMPVAAAAVLAVALTARFWFAASDVPTAVVSIGPTSLVQGTPGETPAARTVVSFARTSAVAGGPSPETGISYMALGAEPLDGLRDYSAPL